MLLLRICLKYVDGVRGARVHWLDGMREELCGNAF